VNETKDEDVLKRAMFERVVVYLCLRDSWALLAKQLAITRPKLFCRAAWVLPAETDGCNKRDILTFIEQHGSRPGRSCW